ncbi:MAG TPA: hypothetical protein VF594_10960 [Rubricoccaceae bacterium]|jgi:hypothetical protein
MPRRFHLLTWPLCLLWVAFNVGPAMADGVALVGHVLALMLQSLIPVAVADSLDAVTHVPEAVLYPLWLTGLGVYPDRLFAGFCGGYVHMGLTSKANTPFRTWFIAVSGASLTGNFLPLVIGLFIPALHELSDVQYKGLAFVLGYVGFSGIGRLQRLLSSSSIIAPPGSSEPGDQSP